MLVKNVNGVQNSASMFKKSEFYVEIAKFVQAYTTIISNPNEFLSEINASPINEEEERLSWAQLVKIMQNCELGFKEKPSASDLVVFYNYAVEIGSIDSTEKVIASVENVADAQKHYYNFVGQAKDRAEKAYLHQKKVRQMRENEEALVDNKISATKSLNYTCLGVMIFACMIVGFGIASLIFSNVVANAIGLIFNLDKPNYLGGSVLIVLGIILFAVFDRFYIKTKRDYVKLMQASSTIFQRADDNYLIECNLKKKLSKVEKEFKNVEAELNDKDKKNDVLYNIESLKRSNKFYKKLCAFEPNLFEKQENQEQFDAEQNAFEPAKLTKEQVENMRGIKKEAISLEGQFDVDAYNEKFEKKKKSKKADSDDKPELKQESKILDESQIQQKSIVEPVGFSQIQQEKSEDELNQKDFEDKQKEDIAQSKKQEEQNNKKSEIEQEKLKQQQDLQSSIDFIKNVLGFSDTEFEKER